MPWIGWSHNPEVAGSNPALHPDPWIDVLPMHVEEFPAVVRFAGATGLEPETSGVTGRVRVHDAWQRTHLNGVIRRHFSE